MSFLKRVIVVFLFTVVFTNVYSQSLDTLINVGNYKLHFNIIMGEGIPIIFEAGAGNDGSVWNNILKPLQDSLGVTLITYDRAGFGKSGIDTANLNIITEVKGLETALIRLGFTDKYFFVAHSLGGNYVMKFTESNSKKVVGGVFIDVVSPCFMTAEKAHAVRYMFKDSLEAIKKESLGFYYIIKNYEHTSEIMRQASKSLRIPLTIICADVPPFEGSESVRWKKCMELFAAEFPNRKFVIAKNSQHYIFKDDPSLVVKEIIEQYKR